MLRKNKEFDQLLTVTDVASFLNVSKCTVYGWIRKGNAPPHIRLNGTIRFPRTKLHLWINQSECGQRAAA